MPVPLAPVAAIALRYGTVALATYAMARRIERGRRDQRAEDALDEIQEGATLRREPGEISATGRFRRVIRTRADGPGLEFDWAGFTRFRFRRTD